MMLPLGLLCATRIPTLTMKRLMRRFPGGLQVVVAFTTVGVYRVCVELE